MNIQDQTKEELVVELQETVFSDIFKLADVQHLQDLFADAHGVASIITDTEGKPITKPSNFTRLCENIIRKTDKGCANCFKSNAVIERYNPEGVVVQPCLCGGLWNAGASINVGGIHLANWMIGQVRNEQVDEHRIMQYADEIGANREDFKSAFNEVLVMSSVQFQKIANLLFVFANELSEKAFSNIQLGRQIADKEKAIANLQEREERYRNLMLNLEAGIVVHAPDTSIVMNNAKASELLGLSNDQLRGKAALDPDWKFIIDDNTSLPFDDYPVNRIVKSKKPIKNQTFCVVQPGKSKLVWLTVNGFPVMNKEGEIIEVVISFIDITERKMAENQLVVSGQKLKEAQQIAHMGNWELNIETNELFWSDEIYRIFDCAPHEFKANYEAFLEFIHPDDREIVNSAYLESLETKKEYQIEHRVLTKNNQMKYVREKCLTTFNDRGKPLSSFGVVIDITEQKQIEIELAESTERFRALHNASFGGIAIHDQGIILECNQGLSDMTGYSLEELFNMDGLLLIAPEYRELVRNNIITGNEKPYEADGLRKNGEQFPMRLEARNIPYKGKSVRTVEFRDITESKKAEEALCQSEERFKLAMRASSDGLFDWNLLTNEVYYSVGWKKMLGYEDHELPNDFSIWANLTEPGDVEKSWELQQQLILKQIDRFVMEFKMNHKDGHWVDILSRAKAIFNDSGQAVRIVGTHTDISERKQAEQELIIAKAKAEESDRLKSAFLANMSHEIRTPMNGILGFASLLKEPDLTGDEQQKYIRIIENSGARMLNTINNIVDISKIEAGLMKVDLNESNINDQIEYIYTFFKPEVENKKMHLLLKNSIPAKDAIIVSDPEKIYAILTNLVKNAIKYTHKGSIELACEIRGEYLMFCVKDTGIGIDKNRQAAIFERFIQADILDSHAYQGSGLGLAISKAYVEMLGGMIWVDSEPGKGSIFYFTIPYNKISQEYNSITKIVSQDDQSAQLKNR